MGSMKTGRKTSNLHIRLTTQDMETLRTSCKAAGYKSMTKYVTQCFIHNKAVPRCGCKAAGAFETERLYADLDFLKQQLRGIAVNYNQTVAVLNTLIRNVENKKVQAYIIRRAANLDSLSHEIISVLDDIKSLVGKAVSSK